MSTANKLSYLNDTKSLLRTSLNKFGSNILSTDTFRSYDTKLNDIYDKLPKITQSGAGFTIENVQNGLVDDFKMTGVDLEQDTTTGKNLWGGFQNSFSKTNADIDFVTNKDGTITANGTANGTAYSMYGSEATNNGFLKTLSPGNYVISGATSEIAINVVKSDGTGISSTGGNFGATFTLSEETQLFVRLQIYNKTVNNVTIKPMLESGTTATNYEPYTGGIASPNPDYPQEIKVVEGRQVITDKGKNLLNPYTEPTERYGITASYNQNTHVYTFNGTCTRDNVTFILSNNKINFTKQVTKSITFWVGGSCTNSCDIRHFDSNYNSNVVYSIVNISSTNNKISKTSNYTFESPINYATIRFNNGSVANNLQIKVMVTDDDNTDYEPYYNPVSYNINLHGKNVFNLEKYPFTPKVAYSSTGYQELNWTGYSGIKDYFPINGNTTYSFSNSTGLDIYYGLVFYDKNKTIISNITAHTTTFTTPSNCEYIRFSIHTEELPTWVQIEEGSTTTNYEEYYDYKLAKIPNTDYKNRIYKSNGNWYFEENVKNIVLDGSEEITIQNIGTDNWYYQLSVNCYKTEQLKQMCSHYNNSGIYNSNTYQGIMMLTEGNFVRIRYGEEDTLANFKMRLSNNNVELWYPLINSITTQITNTTLINQLEAISVHTGTNIITLSSDNNMTPQIEITRLKELERLS